MKKKFVSIVLVAFMVITMTAGCGKSEPDALPGNQSVTNAPDDTKNESGTLPENQTGTNAPDDTKNESGTLPENQSGTDAAGNTENESGTLPENQTGTDTPGNTENESGTSAPETSADAPKQVYILDYDELDAWISYGFKGTSPSGKVLLGINSNNDYGIIIITDDSDMTVVSYVGAYERSYDDSIDYGYITIADEVNGQELKFGFKELSDGELEIDMGDLGVVRVAFQTRPLMMIYIEEIIKEYTTAV